MTITIVGSRLITGISTSGLPDGLTNMDTTSDYSITVPTST